MFRPTLGISQTVLYFLTFCSCLTLILIVYLLLWPRLQRGTPLRGPPSPSWIFGLTKALTGLPQAGLLYERWAETYGPAYSIACEGRRSCVVLCDPKAVQHFYAHETREYIHTPLLRTFVERMLGRSLFWAEGETHRRYKKALASAFRPAAIKDMLPIFYSSAQKVAAAWDQLTSTEGPIEVDVQDWMTRFAYDTIGNAGFGLDFGTLRGRRSAVIEGIDSLKALQTSLVAIIQFALSLVAPAALKIPTPLSRCYNQLEIGLNNTVHEICEALRVEEHEGNPGFTGSSLIHQLLRTGDGGLQPTMSPEEVRSQLKLLLLTGYVTTANCLTWCLVELSRKPHTQRKLREELATLSSAQPSLDHLVKELPYLDAVLHETLRLHPPLTSTTRVASQDDVIPLSVPITTASRDLVDRISVSKGQLVTVPIYAMNTSSQLWGPDAKEFNPDRFLDKGRIPQQIPGHKHILTFVHGQRMCPGRHYALAEMKVVLCLLIQTYAFELLDGADSEVNVIGDIGSIPGVPGGDDTRVPLRVRRLSRTLHHE